MRGNSRLFLLVAVCTVLVSAAGLLVGKKKEKAYLESLETYHNFTLLDDNDQLFELNKFPANQRLLLIFTPDGIPTDSVKATYDFGTHIADLAKKKTSVRLVTRTNKEIVANFKRVARFDAPVLYDMSGVVGRAAGIWPGLDPVDYWGYSLIDNQFHIFWQKTSVEPLSYQEVLTNLPDR
jgi:peroxiredoxin